MVERLGPYELLSPIGSGGMGEVFLARLEREEGFTRQVAIKRILPRLSGDPMFRRMFVAEAKLSASIQHPHVVQVLDFGHEGDSYYLVMEYVEGADLASIISTARDSQLSIPLDFCLSVLQACVRALGHAHSDSAKLVHGDICPANVLIGRHGEVKLTDFGLVRMKSTGQGMIAGHLAYLAPELAMGEIASLASDQFSLGAMTLEMLRGEGPYPPTQDQEKAIEFARRGQLTGMQEIPDDMHPGMLAMLRKMLQVNPEERFKNMGELQQVLELLMDGMSVSVGDTAVEKFYQELRIRPRPEPQQKGTAPTIVSKGHDSHEKKDSKKGTRKKALLFLGTIITLLALLFAYLFFGHWSNNGTRKASPRPASISSTKTNKLQMTAETKPHKPPGSPKPLAVQKKVKTKIVRAMTKPRAELKKGTHAKDKKNLLLSTGPGTAWSLGGAALENAPLRDKTLSTGTHILRLQQGKLLATIRMEISGKDKPVRISVQTSPFAIVKLDNKPRGTSPLGKLELREGRHILSLIAGTAVVELNMIVP